MVKKQKKWKRVRKYTLTVFTTQKHGFNLKILPVYVYISVKGSRVCKPCNVLAVRKYVRGSVV